MSQYKYKRGVDPEDRFKESVAVGSEDECWLWSGKKLPNGYGYLNINRRIVGAHRYALIREDGVERPECFVLHSCDVRLCCNPKHLRWGTQSENMNDIWKRNEVFKASALPRLRRTVKFAQEVARKFDEEKLRQAREMIAKGMADADIAPYFNVSRRTIGNIRNSKYYK